MSSQKTFKKAAGLMAAAVLLSRVLGLIRDMLIARQFGQGAMVSAYTLAFNLPDTLYFFLSSGALSSAFIPVFVEYFSSERKKDAWEIFSAIGCLMTIVLGGAILLCELFTTPLVTRLVAPGYADNAQLTTLIVDITRVVLPCQLFFFLGGLMMGTLEARQNFKARAAGPIIYNLGIIFGALVLSKWFSIYGLAWGAFIGAFVGNVGYTFYHLKKDGFEFRAKLNIRHPGVKKVGLLALPVILGLSLPQIDVIINRTFATFVSAAAPAVIYNSNRLMQVPLGIFAQAAGMAILPLLSAYAAQGAFAEMRKSIGYGLRTIFVENIPATLFMVVMADPIVRIIYMGGEFRPSDVPITTIALAFYSAGIFAWAGQAIVARGFFALQDTKTPVIIGTVSTAFFIPLNYYLMLSMGVAGIALSTTIAATVHFVLLCWYLRKRLGGIEGKKTLGSAVRILIAASVMAAVCYGVRLEMSGRLGSWQLQDGDFRDAGVLAHKLKSGADPLSGYLYSRLSTNTRMIIDESQRSAWNEPAAKEALVADFNKIISGPCIYDKDRYKRLAVHVRKLLAEHPASGTKLMRLNRLLLASAYPSHINEGKSDNSCLLTINDIDEPVKLAITLADSSNKMSSYILNRLSAGTIQLLAPVTMSYVLMHDLNLVIKSDQIYSPERFSAVALPEKLSKLTPTSPKPSMKINRLLLQAAYPNEIFARPNNRVESKVGSLVTVLIAMGLGGIVYFGLLRLLRVEEADFVWNTISRKILKRPQTSN